MTDTDIVHAIADSLEVCRSEVLYWTTFDEIGLDSIDVMDLRFRLQNRYDMELPYDDWLKCRAIGDVCRLVQRVALTETEGELSCIPS